MHLFSQQGGFWGLPGIRGAVAQEPEGSRYLPSAPRSCLGRSLSLDFNLTYKDHAHSGKAACTGKEGSQGRRQAQTLRPFLSYLSGAPPAPPACIHFRDFLGPGGLSSACKSLTSHGENNARCPSVYVPPAPQEPPVLSLPP